MVFPSEPSRTSGDTNRDGSIASEARQLSLERLQDKTQYDGELPHSDECGVEEFCDGKMFLDQVEPHMHYGMIRVGRNLYPTLACVFR